MDYKNSFTYFVLLTALLTDDWGKELAEDKKKDDFSPKALNSDASAKVHALLTGTYALKAGTDFSIYYSYSSLKKL